MRRTVPFHIDQGVDDLIDDCLRGRLPPNALQAAPGERVVRATCCLTSACQRLCVCVCANAVRVLAVHFVKLGQALVQRQGF